MTTETKERKQTPAEIEIDRLRDIYDRAHVHERECEETKSDWIYQKKAEIVREAAQLFDPAITEASKRRADAAREYEAAVYTEAHANAKPYPVGTKMQKPKMNRYGREMGGFVYGVIEIWGPHSVYPENHGKYRRPNVGRTVIRLLKQDGSLSKDYDGSPGFFTSSGRNWKPVTPIE
jgi:hypothetical protein